MHRAGGADPEIPGEWDMKGCGLQPTMNSSRSRTWIRAQFMGANAAPLPLRIRRARNWRVLPAPGPYVSSVESNQVRPKLMNANAAGIKTEP